MADTTAFREASKPIRPPEQLAIPVTAVFGALLGFLFGQANGAPLIGVAVGALIGAGIAYAAATVFAGRKLAGVAAGTAIASVAAGIGIGTVGEGFSLSLGSFVVGGLAGLVLGFIGYWLVTGNYRRGTPVYATSGQVLWFVTYRVICGLIFFFLIAPIVTIIPLSFNAEQFFTFTEGMLALDPDAYSLRHYRDFFSNPDWLQPLWNSVRIAPMATLIAVTLGTLAAVGLSQSHVPFKGAIMAVMISPMIVPLIISAAGMYFFYSRIGLQGTYWGVVLAHAALGIPFVIITVTATLVGFDRALTRAAANLGASPLTTFFRVQMPLILPGVISGGLFAFITSFDEVVVVIFVGSAGQQTLPWQMFTGLREQISPTILAVATVLVAISIALLTTVEVLRRRSERLRGMTPG